MMKSLNRIEVDQSTTGLEKTSPRGGIIPVPDQAKDKVQGIVDAPREASMQYESETEETANPQDIKAATESSAEVAPKLAQSHIDTPQIGESLKVPNTSTEIEKSASNPLPTSSNPPGRENGVPENNAAPQVGDGTRSLTSPRSFKKVGPWGTVDVLEGQGNPSSPISARIEEGLGKIGNSFKRTFSGQDGQSGILGKVSNSFKSLVSPSGSPRAASGPGSPRNPTEAFKNFFKGSNGQPGFGRGPDSNSAYLNRALTPLTRCCRAEVAA